MKISVWAKDTLYDREFTEIATFKRIIDAKLFMRAYTAEYSFPCKLDIDGLIWTPAEGWELPGGRRSGNAEPTDEEPFGGKE